MILDFCAFICSYNGRFIAIAIWAHMFPLSQIYDMSENGRVCLWMSKSETKRTPKYNTVPGEIVIANRNRCMSFSAHWSNLPV